MAFQKAVKRESKLRMAISGPAGAGKTWTALTLATRLADGGRVAVLDTERGSASKYADDFDFDADELESFDPRNYVKAIHEAEEAGFSVLVIDSLTHAWNGTGGLLDIVDAIAKRKYNNNTFAAWKDATPLQNQLIDALTSAKLHIIVTMRSKMDHAQEKNEKTGRVEVKKLGMAPIQRDGMEYEFDIVADMDIDNNMIIQKSRCSKLSGQIYAKPDGKVADVLKEWLRGAPAEQKAPTPPRSLSPQQATSEPTVQARAQERPARDQQAQPAPVANEAKPAESTPEGKRFFKPISANVTSETPKEQVSTDEPVQAAKPELTQNQQNTQAALKNFANEVTKSFGKSGAKVYQEIREQVIAERGLGGRLMYDWSGEDIASLWTKLRTRQTQNHKQPVTTGK